MAEVRKAAKKATVKVVPKKTEGALALATHLLHAMGYTTPVVPKKPKAAKAPKAKKETGLVPVAPAAMQAIHPEAPAAGLSNSFIKEAQKLDAQIVKTLERVGKDIVFLGESFGEMQSKGYHTALGFKRFEDYLAARWPDQSKTQIFQAMRVVRELTSGENPAVSKEDVREMTAANAEGLAQLKKQGHVITRELIQEAKTLPIKRFQQEIVLPRSPELAQRVAVSSGLHISSGPEILVRRTSLLSGPTEAMRVKCFEICRWLNKEDDEDRSHPADEGSFDDKAYQAIFAEFLSTYQAEYEQVMAEIEARELSTAQTHSAKMGEITTAEVDNLASAAVPQTAEDGEEAEAADSAVLDDEDDDEEEDDDREYREEPEEGQHEDTDSLEDRGVELGSYSEGVEE